MTFKAKTYKDKYHSPASGFINDCYLRISKQDWNIRSLEGFVNGARFPIQWRIKERNYNVYKNT